MEDIKKTFKKRLFFSIAVTALMCPILGIISILFNFQSKVAYENNDIEDYKISNKIANIVIVCGFIVGILTWTCIIGGYYLSKQITTYNSEINITSENNLSETTNTDCIMINDKTFSIPIDCKTFIDKIPYTLGTDIKTTYLDKKETISVELWDKNMNTIGEIKVFNSNNKVENIESSQVVGIKLNKLNDISFKYLSLTNNSNLNSIEQILGDNENQEKNGKILVTSWSIDNYFINITWDNSKIKTFEIEFNTNF